MLSASRLTLHGSQYLFAIGSSCAGKSVMILAPLGVSTTSSSMRAADTPSVAGQNVSTANTIPAFNSYGSLSELSRDPGGRSCRPKPRPWQKLSPNADISVSKPISVDLGNIFATWSVLTPGL